jgi:hypothetical protein
MPKHVVSHAARYLIACLRTFFIAPLARLDQLATPTLEAFDHRATLAATTPDPRFVTTGAAIIDTMVAGAVPAWLHVPQPLLGSRTGESSVKGTLVASVRAYAVGLLEAVAKRVEDIWSRRPHSAERAPLFAADGLFIADGLRALLSEAVRGRPVMVPVPTTSGEVSALPAADVQSLHYILARIRAICWIAVAPLPALVPALLAIPVPEPRMAASLQSRRGSAGLPPTAGARRDSSCTLAAPVAGQPVPGTVLP